MSIPNEADIARREKRDRAEKASEIANWGEALLCSIEKAGDKDEQLQALDAIEKLAAELRAAITGVVVVPKTFALLKVSQRRWVILRRVCDHVDGIRRMAYTEFGFEGGTQSCADAKSSLRIAISELPEDQRAAHVPTIKPEKHHGTDRPLP